MRGREGRRREGEGRRGAGGGRGEEKREGGEKGKILCARSARRSRREEGDNGAGGGGVRGREGERPTPPLSAPSYIDVDDNKSYNSLIPTYVLLFFVQNIFSFEPFLVKLWYFY